MPEVEIVEQPASKETRFRYECEGRSAGSIPGVSSTKAKKTFPAIRIVGAPGRKAVVVVSCVTADPPYRPHPHNLVGRDGCKKGVCTLEIPADKMYVTFPNLGIQCVKKKSIEASLNQRKELRIDPFKTGYSSQGIDLNAVRLCFQVFMENERCPGRYNVPLAPKLSNPIYDKKIKSDLTITKLSDCVSNVDGGQKDIIMLCEKITKEDIQVRFFEEIDDKIIWEDYAATSPGQVHKQHALWFKAPPYRSLDVQDPVKVLLQLRRPSDGATSDPVPFQYIPSFKSKKKRPLEVDYSDLNLVDEPRYEQYSNEPPQNVLTPMSLHNQQHHNLQPHHQNSYATIHNYPNQSPQYILSPSPSPSTNPFLNYNIPYSNSQIPPWTGPAVSATNQQYYMPNQGIAAPSSRDWHIPQHQPQHPSQHPPQHQQQHPPQQQQQPLPDLGHDLNNLSISDIVPDIVQI